MRGVRLGERAVVGRIALAHRSLPRKVTTRGTSASTRMEQRWRISLGRRQRGPHRRLIARAATLAIWSDRRGRDVCLWPQRPRARVPGGDEVETVQLHRGRKRLLPFLHNLDAWRRGV